MGLRYCLHSSTDYYSFLDSLDTLSNIDLVEPYYTTDEDSALVIGDQFAVAFNGDVTSTQIDSINSLYGTVFDHLLDYVDDVMVLRNTKQSGMRTLDIANLFYNLDETIFSHPIFSVRPIAHGYTIFDEYSQYQPHLKKVIGQFNVRSVWDFARLDLPITVAVIDYGAEVHEDLPADRLIAGYDFGNRDSDPSPSPYPDAGGGHGMAVAGIIGASHKTLQKSDPPQDESGIFSIAPEARIMPIKIWNDDAVGTRIDTIAMAIGYAWRHGADVISCSWGLWGSQYGWDLVAYAIDQAYNCGRGEGTSCTGEPRGCPVVFSSGNDGFDWVRFPSSLPTTISVGAVRLDDYRWGYSQYGENLDLVAPSGDKYLCYGDFWSLDLMGDAGYNPTADWSWDCGPIVWDCGWQNDVNYDCKFGGTSAAEPVVAGVAALILSYDSNLTADRVYDILRHSATTDLDWGTITPHDNEYGYGRVDAFRAILSLARGDMNADGKANLSDLTLLIAQVYQGGAGGFPDIRLGNCDCSGDGKINLSDVTTLIDHVYVNHTPLPLPCFNYLYPNQ